MAADLRSCPNCGGALPRLLAHARMVDCEFCGSSIVVDDQVVAKAGEAGEMLDAPELIGLGRAVQLGDFGIFTATGHVRYDYGRGHWDEYHGSFLTGDLVWVSVDEGDVAMQTPLPKSEWPHARDAFRLGGEVTVRNINWRVSEVENATCVAFRGQLPEPVAVGDVHMYANLSAPGGLILSGERWDGGMAWFAGQWIDPFEVRPA
ncbi:DUF4178 domain-containing protein [Jannaschia aquimarina]|uniref:DUF4178 domain-containing protein n=1 Tax=Jannaschia aquimarina TaxID=935700 RepID=A0A0D1DDG7_9RHOB|nr:DUF4178 domain-containing protein [Jannaschia aquimarina]KIT18033.1 hypothetical protein jaqu_01580 [Jannaschia aquimarina]SNS88937.1 protein of unknown function [Jannaschia aquimarina]